MSALVCPACGRDDEDFAFIGIEYAYGSPCHYDGVSEWLCPDCRTRVGRWTGRVLTGDMVEPPFGRGISATPIEARGTPVAGSPPLPDPDSRVEPRAGQDEARQARQATAEAGDAGAPRPSGTAPTQTASEEG